ncbi:MAG: 50S ribosomal protein L29 [Erysipelotrichaceae bacterium]|nr:50S ribosomal protein L29 [Erysipelotrichaceae bacterium]
MNIKEVREKSSADLQKTLDEMKVELFDLRFARATGSIENPMRIRELKKSIARILTVLHERESEVKEG